MLLDDQTTPKIIYLLANVNGDIIYNSEGFLYNIQGTYAEGISEIIDSDTFMKISMKDRYTGFVHSQIRGYSMGILSTEGGGISKGFELILFNDSDFFRNGTVYRELAGILSTEYEDKREELHVLDKIKEAERELKGTYNINGIQISAEIDPCDTGYMEPYFSKAVIMCIMYAFHEAGFFQKITLRAQDTEYGKKITFSTYSGSGKTVKGIYDFCVEYPSASAITALARAICNMKGINLIIDCSMGNASISVVFPKSEIKEFSVYNSFINSNTKDLSVGK